VRADDIPVAHTPPGGYGDAMPPPVLDGCTEPLGGLWRVVEVEWHGDPPDHDEVAGHTERIEQCGDRVCITSAGVIHDMRADGSEERGVHDVAAVGGRPIDVTCTFESGVHTLRPVGMPGVAVTRHLEGDQLVWRYGPLFTARLERVND
jgi:hypothetical protein